MSPILLSAETHTLPSGVAPFPGVETDTGGRIRDVQATGTDANVTVSTVGYSVGALTIPGYKLPWEETLRVDEAADHRDRCLERRIRSSSASR